MPEPLCHRHSARFRGDGFQLRFKQIQVQIEPHGSPPFRSCTSTLTTSFMKNPTLRQYRRSCITHTIMVSRHRTWILTVCYRGIWCRNKPSTQCSQSYPEIPILEASELSIEQIRIRKECSSHNGRVARENVATQIAMQHIFPCCYLRGAPAHYASIPVHYIPGTIIHVAFRILMHRIHKSLDCIRQKIVDRKS